jgi:hypothetical protein
MEKLSMMSLSITTFSTSYSKHNNTQRTDTQHTGIHHDECQYKCQYADTYHTEISILSLSIMTLGIVG